MTERERDEETGQFVDKYPLEEVIEVIQELGGKAATSEIAETLDAERNTVYKKLRAMEDNSEISSTKAGGIRIWSVDNNQ